MTKLVLNDVANAPGQAAAINSQLDRIEAEFDKVLYRDGTSPNAMGDDLDMNSNRITNLPAPVNNTEPARKVDLDNAIIGSIDKALVDLDLVDNTADADKPVSTPQQQALDGKHSLGTTLATIEADAPAYFAHRGLPNVYPEASMIAFRSCTAAGSKIIEMDVQLLADGALGVMHDDTIDRTTSSTGNVGDQSSASWSNLTLDSSSFLGAGWADTKPPFFEEVLREFGNRVVICPEAKAGTGVGAAMTTLMQRYGISTDMALVQSFYSSELTAAIAAGYPTLYLIDTYAGSPTPAALVATGYRWIGTSVNTATAQMDALRAAGLKVGLYTLNTRYDVATYASHIDGVFTNDEIYLRGIARRDTDPFKSQKWYHGHQASISSAGAAGGRGAFYSPDQWGYDMSASNVWAGALQGWASPIGGSDVAPGTITINFSMQMDAALDANRFAWLALLMDDVPFASDSVATSSGYNFLIRKSGDIEIFKYTKGVGNTSLGGVATAALTLGSKVTYRITVSPTSVSLARTSGTTGTMTASDTTFRPAYLHAGAKGAFVKYSGFSIT